MGLDPLTIGAFALGVGGAVQSREAQKSAQREQKKSQREQEAAQAQQAAMERRRQVREERVRRASIIQSAQTSGVGQSSGQLGAQSSLTAQLGTNLGFGASQRQFSRNISQQQQRASDYMGEANMWSGVSNLGFQTAFSGLSFGDLVPTQNPAPVRDSIFR